MNGDNRIWISYFSWYFFAHMDMHTHIFHFPNVSENYPYPFPLIYVFVPISISVQLGSRLVYVVMYSSIFIFSLLLYVCQLVASPCYLFYIILMCSLFQKLELSVKIWNTWYMIFEINMCGTPQIILKDDHLGGDLLYM